MLKNPDGPNSVELVVLEGQIRCRSLNKRFVKVPGRRRGDVEAGVILDQILESARPGADLQDTFAAEPILFDKLFHLAVDVLVVGREPSVFDVVAIAAFLSTLIDALIKCLGAYST